MILKRNIVGDAAWVERMACKVAPKVGLGRQGWVEYRLRDRVIGAVWHQVRNRVVGHLLGIEQTRAWL